MDDGQAIEIAKHVVSAWGRSVREPRLIRNRENIVFEVAFDDGQKAALRLHRTGYQTREAIESELIWTERLAQKNVPCPLPLRTLDGELTVGDPVASAVKWINAEPIGENGVVFAAGEDAHCELYRSVGQLIRKLHDATDAVSTDDLVRSSWAAEALLGEDPLWGRFWKNPSLSRDEVEVLQQARANAAQHLQRLDPDIGLIHADLLQENILQNASGLWLIDFDDSGFGYRGYDLGTALIQHAELDYLPALERALCDGYEAESSLRESLSLFTMLRSMASCGWILSRARPEDPRQRFYAERALTCTRRYNQTTTSISA